MTAKVRRCLDCDGSVVMVATHLYVPDDHTPHVEKEPGPPVDPDGDVYEQGPWDAWGSDGPGVPRD